MFMYLRAIVLLILYGDSMLSKEQRMFLANVVTLSKEFYCFRVQQISCVCSVLCKSVWGLLFLFGIAGKVAQEHAPKHAHQAGKGDLPLFGHQPKQDHLGGDPKHEIFLPAGEKLAFHSIDRLLKSQSLNGTGERAIREIEKAMP